MVCVWKPFIFRFGRKRSESRGRMPRLLGETFRAHFVKRALEPGLHVARLPQFHGRGAQLAPDWTRVEDAGALIVPPCHHYVDGRAGKDKRKQRVGQIAQRRLVEVVERIDACDDRADAWPRLDAEGAFA